MKRLILNTTLMTTYLVMVVVLTAASGEKIQKEGNGMTVSEGKKVSIEYTLKLEDDMVVDSNVDGQPLTYIVGKKQIIPGLEAALNGLKVGDSKNVEINPEQAYGPIQEDAVITLPIDKLPEELREKGKQVQMQSQDGQVHNGVIHEIGEDSAVIDFNHPLAGKILFFEIKIVKVDDI
jgi:FKBP-type peptidyl-prolyl cis-trans isomerase 2